MNRLILALSALVLFSSAAFAQGQSVSRAFRPADSATITQPDRARAIAALQRLEREVIVYQSLGDFEETRRLARVDYSIFMRELTAVTNELEPILSRLPATRFRTQLTNALDSYRDGAFWWSRIVQPRVVNISALSYAENQPTPSDAAFNSNIPYTVAIHWRQAAAFLKRAEQSPR